MFWKRDKDHVSGVQRLAPSPNVLLSSPSILTAARSLSIIRRVRSPCLRLLFSYPFFYLLLRLPCFLFYPLRRLPHLLFHLLLALLYLLFYLLLYLFF